MRKCVASCALLLGVVGCTNAGQNSPPLTLRQSSIAVGVYFDRNANHVLDAADTAFAGVRLALLLPGGNDTVGTAVTNTAGLAIFDSVAIGTYRIVVDRHALGDSIGVVAGDTGTVRLIADPDSESGVHTVRLGFTEVTIAQARALAPGERVVVHARVTSPLQQFHDSSAFISDTSGNLRIVDAVAQHGTSGNTIGDSVLVLGTTGALEGQPVLIDGHFTLITPGVAPLPQLISVADARTAKGGTLDAAFIQVSNVVIMDTMPATPDFVLKVADPADTTVQLTVVLDQLLNAPHSFFAPKQTATLRGVLIPNGDGTWLLKPRGASDVVLN